MSAVSESMNRRMTLGLLASRYGFDLDPTFATEVTITSIADDIDSVRPGSLFMPSAPVDVQQLRQAQTLGAYGAVVPHALRGKTEGIQIPVIYAEPTAPQLGRLASEMAGSPSDSLAVFAVAGNDAQAVDQGVRDLADFLHMLGNPVGVISSGNSQSLERGDNGLGEAEIVKSVARFGCTVGKRTHIAVRTQESDALASQAAAAYGQTNSSALSLSISMVLAAGVRKANIKSALRVSRDLN